MPIEGTVWLSLGSNIRPCANLRAALRLLDGLCKVDRCSPVYRTSPRGDRDQADFLNMAARVRTTLSPEAFHRDVIQAIESQLKRKRDPRNRNAARSIDVDIALWGDAVLRFGSPPRQVPDPDILRFAHVALPLAALDPLLRHPVTGQTLGEIATALGAEGIFRLDGGLENCDDPHSPAGALRVK